MKPHQSERTVGIEQPADISTDVTADFRRSGKTEAEAHSKVGRYTIKRLIGTGGFGNVFLAHDPVLTRDVALKIPKRYTEWSGEDLGEFIKEARALAKLQHPNIITVYDAGVDQGTPFIAMEYVDGNPLSRLSPERSGREKLRDLLGQVALGLHEAHKRGFVHRDLKPDNVLVTKEGVAKITDFGLAVRDEEAANYKGTFAGTLPYMSPEQVLKKTHLLDGRSDIWSLGVMIYQCYTNTKPFKADTTDDVCEQILNRHPKPLRQSDDSIPSDIESLCLHCLEKDPRDRPATALDVHAKLSHHIPFSRKLKIAAACLFVLTIVIFGGAMAAMLGDNGDDSTATNGGESIIETIESDLPPFHDFTDGQHTYQLLDRVPQSLVVPSRTEQELDPLLFSYDKDRESVSVHSIKHYSLFDLGESPNRSYLLRVELAKGTHRGIGGFFFGFRPEDSTAGEQSEFWSCHTVTVSCFRTTAGNQGDTTHIVRKRLRFQRIGKNQFRKVAPTSNDAAAIDVPAPGPLGRNLFVRVENQRIGLVSWDRVPHVEVITQLVDPTDESWSCVGRFGIINSQGETIFRNAALLFD